MENPKYSYRSVFWPIILIGVGAAWFAGNIELIPEFSWGKLASLWPLLLVGIGLDLLVGRRNVWLSAVVGAATVGAAVLLLINAPATGMFQSGDVKTYTFSEPIDAATSAKVVLDLSAEPVKVRALNDPAILFQADIAHNGGMQFSASGSGGEKVITLRAAPVVNFSFWNWGSFDNDWAIGLSPKVPLALEVDVSAGAADLDLSGLQLTSVKIDGGAGQMTLTLPAQNKLLDAQYEGSAGAADIHLPGDTDINLRLDGSAGAITVRLPANAAVRVEVLDEGAGAVSLAGRLRKISGSSAKKGVWETEGYAGAARKISIVVADVSAGAITIR